MLSSHWCRPRSGNTRPESAACVAAQTAPRTVVLARSRPAVCTPQAEWVLLTCEFLGSIHCLCARYCEIDCLICTNSVLHALFCFILITRCIMNTCMNTDGNIHIQCTYVHSFLCAQSTELYNVYIVLFNIIRTYIGWCTGLVAPKGCNM